MAEELMVSVGIVIVGMLALWGVVALLLKPGSVKDRLVSRLSVTTGSIVFGAIVAGIIYALLKSIL